MQLPSNSLQPLQHSTVSTEVKSERERLLQHLINLDRSRDTDTQVPFDRSTLQFADKAGAGTFGVVTKAIIKGTNHRVAIKRVHQDPNYKNRELSIMKCLDHPNCVKMRGYYYDTDPASHKTYLNVVMDYMPNTIADICTSRRLHTPSQRDIKLYCYQFLRAAAYFHGLGICHRDIKPQNILLDPRTKVAQICDFGSAKVLRPGESSISYICSRYYRAPELILGAGVYTPAVDIWSLGCVIYEMLCCRPFFPGRNNSDQMIQIMKIFGTPTHHQMVDMRVPDISNIKLPAVRARSFLSQFPTWVDPQLVDLLSKMLTYSPVQRITAKDALNHPYFKDFSEGTTQLALRAPAVDPPLFDFTPIERAADPVFYDRLAAAHAGQLTTPPAPAVYSSAPVSPYVGAAQPTPPPLQQAPPPTAAEATRGVFNTGTAPPTSSSVAQPQTGANPFSSATTQVVFTTPPPPGQGAPPGTGFGGAFG